ncbi:MAG: FecR family protein [Prolixibacteraceae bacterium]|nr:FecR family protein [Prolixibacteraceae bacterium]MBN2775121.1 FecR family protein [Prolixibacteraceae bacterium]
MSTERPSQVEDLLPGYFSNEIGEADRVIIENWKNSSEKSLKDFQAFKMAWEAGKILTLMKQFNADVALKKVESRISKSKKIKITAILYKIAAILLLPLIIYSGYLTFSSIGKKSDSTQVATVWNEVKTSTGMQSKFTLPDGSQVWLNSSTTLKYPLVFGDYREVELSGEAFFDVQKKENLPFILKMNKINIEVVGTSFNVLNYSEESQTEITLKSGKIKLFSGNYSDKKEITTMEPGQRAVYVDSLRKVFIDDVEVIKYTAWMEGKLIIDDPMDEVVRKLNRWFNVDMILQDKSLHEYIYKATFEDETLDQVLELLKLSAPIEYTSEPRKLLSNGTFSKRKIIIKKRTI